MSLTVVYAKAKHTVNENGVQKTWYAKVQRLWTNSMYTIIYIEMKTEKIQVPVGWWKKKKQQKKKRKSKELTVYLFKLRKQPCQPSFIAILLFFFSNIWRFILKWRRINWEKKSICTFCFRFQEINQIFFFHLVRPAMYYFKGFTAQLWFFWYCFHFDWRYIQFIWL